MMRASGIIAYPVDSHSVSGSSVIQIICSKGAAPRAREGGVGLSSAFIACPPRACSGQLLPAPQLRQLQQQQQCRRACRSADHEAARVAGVGQRNGCPQDALARPQRVLRATGPRQRYSRCLAEGRNTLAAAALPQAQ